MSEAVYSFMIFYFGVSIALMFLFYFFKNIIQNNWFLYIPIILAGLVFFPFGFVIFGYYLRMYDERREDHKYEMETDEMSEGVDSIPIDSEMEW